MKKVYDTLQGLVKKKKKKKKHIGAHKSESS